VNVVFKKNIFMLTAILFVLAAVFSFSLMAEEKEELAEFRIIEVVMNNFDFVPEQINVEPGEKIRFKLINPSSAYHTFTIYNSKTDREEAVVNIALSSGEEKEVVVQMPTNDTELYLVCLPHEGIKMTGKVIVGAGNINN
jgi:plastocyanin